MFFKRFYDTDLAQASYMVGCQKTGECLVIDPIRDTRQYLDEAAAQKLKVTHVTETHIHADFLSGSRELAAQTGARLLLSDEGDADSLRESARRLREHRRGEAVALRHEIRDRTSDEEDI